jgi:ribosomal protein L15
VIKSGELSRKITLRGVAVTAGAKAAIEAAGGNVIIDPPVEKPKKLPSKRV